MFFRRSFILILSMAFFGPFLPGPTRSVGGMDAFDHRIYGELLRKHVKNGWVDYDGFKRDEARLDAYFQSLKETNSRALSREEQLAFYINAYNAWTIKLVLMAYPGLGSIRETGYLWSTPWKKPLCEIDGQKMSLDDLEHQIIRPRFQDPRIHFAVNCASKGCPSLASEPYRGDTLSQQLDASARAFINDSKRNYIEGNTLHASKIFLWYAGDFKEGIIPFFLQYAEGGLKKELEARKDRLQVEYLDYDWVLNGR